MYQSMTMEQLLEAEQRAAEWMRTSRKIPPLVNQESSQCINRLIWRKDPAGGEVHTGRISPRQREATSIARWRFRSAPPATLTLLAYERVVRHQPARTSRVAGPFRCKVHHKRKNLVKTSAFCFEFCGNRTKVTSDYHHQSCYQPFKAFHFCSILFCSLFINGVCCRKRP
jgi:hypothetical protein